MGRETLAQAVKPKGIAMRGVQKSIRIDRVKNKEEKRQETRMYDS